MANSTAFTPPRRGAECPEETPMKVELNPRKPRHMTIVLTGGPCSGKSSILALIRDRLSKRGMQVLTVPEYATHFFANSDGFQVDWVGTQKEEALQDILLRFQVTQENMFHDFASLNSKPAVLLLDRAVMDQKVFVSSDKIWESALKDSSVTEEQLLARYDLVMHLGTCAKGGDYQWGPGSNNPGRYHNPEEAAKLDDTCAQVYDKHKQFRMVPHCGKFEDKVEHVMKYLEEALGQDGLAGKRQRLNVSLSNEVPDHVLAACQSFVITTTFLEQQLQLSVRRRRRVSVDEWLSGLKGDTVQDKTAPHGHSDQTFEQRRSIAHESFLARRVLTEAEYKTEVQLAKSTGIDKHVLSFQVGAGLHYELLYFQGKNDVLLLDLPVDADLPAWLLRSGDEAEMRPQPAGKVAMTSGGRKPARVLKKNSTEEAAVEYLAKSRENKTRSMSIS